MSASYTPEFSAFWQWYPKRHRASANPKKPAFMAYQRALKRTVPDTLLSGAKMYAAECRADSTVGTHLVAQAATWLNQDRWEAYDTTPSGPPTITADSTVNGELGERWRQVSAALSAENPAVYSSYFSHLVLDGVLDGRPMLKARSAFFAAYVRNHYGDVLRRAWGQEVIIHE